MGTLAYKRNSIVSSLTSSPHMPVEQVQGAYRCHIGLWPLFSSLSHSLREKLLQTNRSPAQHRFAPSPLPRIDEYLGWNSHMLETIYPICNYSAYQQSQGCGSYLTSSSFWDGQWWFTYEHLVLWGLILLNLRLHENAIMLALYSVTISYCQ